MSRTLRKVIAISLIFVSILLFALSRWKLGIAVLIPSFILLPSDYTGR